MPEYGPIEKNVPIPKNMRGSGSRTPFWSMEVGDSIFVGLSAAHASALTAPARKAGRKFTVRTVEGGTRIWRIE